MNAEGVSLSALWSAIPGAHLDGRKWQMSDPHLRQLSGRSRWLDFA
jgi:hypothetical protein